MLTDKQKEAAARELCRLRGIDPDKRIAHGADPSPEGYVPGVCLQSPAWMRALREINAQEQLAAALEVGRSHEE
jgi:hypothetical protein